MVPSLNISGFMFRVSCFFDVLSALSLVGISSSKWELAQAS